MKRDDSLVPSGNGYPGSSRKARYGRLKSLSSAEAFHFDVIYSIINNLIF